MMIMPNSDESAAYKAMSHGGPKFSGSEETAESHARRSRGRQEVAAMISVNRLTHHRMVNETNVSTK
jgi:hypothetical protein